PGVGQTQITPPQTRRATSPTRPTTPPPPPPIPGATAPPGFPQYVALPNTGRQAQPYNPAAPLRGASLLIRTDPVTRRSTLMAVEPSGLLTRATGIDIEIHRCQGMWTCNVNGQIINLRIDNNGEVTFPSP
ncbi:MAG: hypothetical protein ACRC9R_09485, partial [Enterovibrio sp.]